MDKGPTAPDSSSARRFSREEAALILRRATEGEQRGQNLIEGGLTLAEIVAAARDAGIDPGAVRRAAALAPAPPDPLQRLFLGAPSNATVTAHFPGHLPPGRFDAARAAIEAALARRGVTGGEDPTGFEWREEHGLGRTSVRARANGPTVEVTAEAERKGHLLALMLALATVVALLLQPLGGFAGLATVIGALPAVLAPVAAVAVGVRLIWSALQRPVQQRLEAAVLEVGAIVEEDRKAGGEERSDSP